MAATSLTDARHPRTQRKRYREPRIDVVVPIYNEAAVLEQSVRRLHEFLATILPFAWRIVIADNASTDASWAIAQRLRADLVGVLQTPRSFLSSRACEGLTCHLEARQPGNG